MYVGALLYAWWPSCGWWEKRGRWRGGLRGVGGKNENYVMVRKIMT